MNSIIYAKEWSKKIVEWKLNTGGHYQGGCYGMMTLARSPDGKLVDFFIATYTFKFEIADKGSFFWGLIEWNLDDTKGLTLAEGDIYKTFCRLKALLAFETYGLIDNISFLDEDED